MPDLKKVKQVRDISLLLSLAKVQQAHGEDGEYSPEVNALMVQKLEALDARTGKRERGKGPALNPASAANVRKATQRRGVRKPR